MLKLNQHITTNIKTLHFYVHMYILFHSELYSYFLYKE